ncbi:uncharacterized protein J3R85_004221 [Psidium guajava]|nr:uncharacterized protein J3R85_004221 [Psidium guajava]
MFPLLSINFLTSRKHRKKNASGFRLPHDLQIERK